VVKDKINIILITGFLGSGKTTLLNRLIDKHSKRKLGLIINDFGKISVDGILLSNLLQESKINDEQSIYEIKNGSIFCSCLSTELVKALKKQIDIKPEILIIETSGLSDPSTFKKILSENKIENEFNILASLCIVDSHTATKLFNKITAIEKQIASADIIVINKMDVAESVDVKGVCELIDKTNPEAKIIETSFGNIDLSKIEKVEKNKKADSKAVSCNTVKSRPGSIILRQKEITIEKLHEFYNLISNKILRLKGFIFVENKLHYVSSNNGSVNIEEYLLDNEPQIGLSVLLLEENAKSVLQEWKNLK
jgi:G3E family GTPase